MNRGRPVLVHLTTADISLELLLGPQLSAYRDAGYEVVGMSAPGPFVPRIEARGVEHVALSNATRAMDLGSDARALVELLRLFRRRRPDIVHTHNPKTGVYGRIAARLAGVGAVVNTVHGLYASPDDSLPRRAVVYTAERIAASCSGAELVQNPDDLNVLRSLRVPQRRLRLLGNGIDLGRFRPDAEVRSDVRTELGLGPADVVVGAVGRLVLEKGFRELFAAWRLVHADAPHARLLVVGPHEPDKADGLGMDEIRAAEESGIVFLGMRDDMERLYNAFDAYVLLSHREGFPRSAMEAAASGLPVVATDIRGCREVVVDRVTGRLVPARDAAAAAAALLDVVTDESGRRSMARAALHRAREQFDQQRVIDITLDAYARLGVPPRPPSIGAAT